MSTLAHGGERLAEREASSVSSGSSTSGDDDSHGGDGLIREGDGERKEGGGGGGGAEAAPGEVRGGVKPEPRVPFCRAGADVGNMWLPAWDQDNQRVQTAKRVLVFGGKGVDYYNRRSGDRLSYLSDMWSLHITNTGFAWSKVNPHGKVQPSPRWQTGDSVAFDRSLVIFGGDDQTTNQIGGLGDLWVYTPRQPSPSFPLSPESSTEQPEWQNYERGGEHPGERRQPSLTIINSTLLLQGGKVVDGESNEVCDSRLFLLDLSDPEGAWIEGAPLPGNCGVGQTMDTVRLAKGDDSQLRALVFGGCQWDTDGSFRCSNDLHAYDLGADRWRLIKPESDTAADACATAAAVGDAAPDVSDTNAPAATTSGEEGTVQRHQRPSEGSGSGGKQRPACPGKSQPRPLGRFSHASAYIESSGDSVHALFIFGGRETADELVPLGDLWMFDFSKMRWSEITPGSKKAPVNRFAHSLTVWAGGAGDGVASLVVFGGETITRTGQAAYLNDVWLYTPHTGTWREVSRSDCQQGASGIVHGGNWTAAVALATMLVLLLLVQCVLHYVCPHYEPPPGRLRRLRSRRRAGEMTASMPSAADGNRAGLLGGGVRGKSAPSLSQPHQGEGLLSKDNKQSYQAVHDSGEPATENLCVTACKNDIKV